MRVDFVAQPADNTVVRRRWLALLICLTAGATLAQILERSVHVSSTVVADRSGAKQTAAPPSDSDPESHWVAASRAIIPATQSGWTSSLAHASLAAAPSGHAFVETYAIGRSDRPARARSAHLLHIPLLI